MQCAKLAHESSKRSHYSQLRKEHKVQAQPWPSAAVAGPMTSVAMRCASSLVITSHDLSVGSEVDGI